MEKLQLPIKREEIYQGRVVLVDGKHKLEFLKDRNIILQSEMLCGKFKNDIFYESPQYNAFPESSDCYKNYIIDFQNYGPIFVDNAIDLDKLLEYFGFPKLLDAKDILDMKNNLYNGTFAYENCKEFGYEMKPDLIWKNGILVPSGIERYCIESYELVKENSISQYFEYLNAIYHGNPEVSFAPFKEEGQIRKRDLHI